MITKSKAVLLAAALILVFQLTCCRKDEKDLYRNIRGMDPEFYSADDFKERERELKAAIREYRDILEMKIYAARNLGIYYKILGKLYFDNRMYKLGAEAFDKAVEIDPENPILFYYAGLCRARYSKSVSGEASAYAMLRLAEKNYLRAVELDNNYTRAMYALSVLYVFEMDKPDEAVELLEKLLEIEKYNFDAMFLLANSYIRMGLLDRADRTYLRIINNAGDSSYRRQAEQNRNALRNFDL